MYRTHLFFLLLIKLDVFFFLIFSVQFLALVLEKTDVEFGLTIAALPVTLIILAIAVHAVTFSLSFLGPGQNSYFKKKKCCFLKTMVSKT